MNESAKCLPLVDHHLKGKVLDVGCGSNKIVPHAFGVDMNAVDGLDLVVTPADVYHLSKCNKLGKFDVVFSSHCLEHLARPWEAVEDWCQLLVPGGQLILYLPFDGYYDNSKNPWHVQVWTLERFKWELDTWLTAKKLRSTAPVELVELVADVETGNYSFLVRLKRR